MSRLVLVCSSPLASSGVALLVFDQVKDYGSFAYGLSLPHGDVDLSVHGVRMNAQAGLEEAGKQLARRAISCRLIHARVPVLKLRDRMLGIEGDLTWCCPGVCDEGCHEVVRFWVLCVSRF